MRQDADQDICQDIYQDTAFVFVTAAGRVRTRLSDGSIADVTDACDLLPQSIRAAALKSTAPWPRTRATQRR